MTRYIFRWDSLNHDNVWQFQHVSSLSMTRRRIKTENSPLEHRIHDRVNNNAISKRTVLQCHHHPMMILGTKALWKPLGSFKSLFSAFSWCSLHAFCPSIIEQMAKKLFPALIANQEKFQTETLVLVAFRIRSHLACSVYLGESHLHV